MGQLSSFALEDIFMLIIFFGPITTYMSEELEDSIEYKSI